MKQKMKHLCAALSAMILTSCLVIAKNAGAQTVGLSFSATQKWLPYFLDLAKGREKEKGALLLLPEPPKNNSREVKAELAQLVEFQAKRNEGWINQILIEKDINNAVFGEFELDDHEQLLTPVGSLVYVFLHQSMGELFAQKKKFDRIRPHILSQKLEGAKPLQTLIETPFHPAYPSGHSFQAHGIALLLAQIAPEQAGAVNCDATRIAVGREVAGVHYASDSAAGANLAKAYMTNWFKRPEVKAQIAEASAWWKQNRDKFLAERAFRKRRLPVDLKAPCTLDSTRKAFLQSVAKSL